MPASSSKRAGRPAKRLRAALTPLAAAVLLAAGSLGLQAHAAVTGAAVAASPAATLAATAATAAGTPAAAAARPAAAEKTIAIMDFELIDDTLETAKDEAQKARLQQISKQLRAAFTENHLYRVVDNAPAAALITDLSGRFALHDCNGCDVDIGRALKTDRVLTAWVQKVSNLILNINVQIRDVRTGLVLLNKSVDIRSNTDDSWNRGIRYMVRSMVEKNQGNL
jgi:hypothetical protein